MPQRTHNAVVAEGPVAQFPGALTDSGNPSS